jgi:peptide/nickel transport system permease protein
MRSYLLRRLLLMIPTFVGISFIVFAVLNLAPGRPGAQTDNADVASNARGEQTQESYAIFREQFNLDKPIFLNTRFALTSAEVRRDLEVVAEIVPGSIVERIALQDSLGDLGNYAVPHLIAVMNDADAAAQAAPNVADAARHIALRDMAAYFLRQASPRRFIDPFDPTPAPEVRAFNEQVAEERAALRLLRYALDAPEPEKRVVLQGWAAWYEAAKPRFAYDWRDKLRILFLDTRFATYWKNLIRLDFGVSLTTRQPVLETLVSKLRYSLSLSVVSLLIAYAIAIPLGIFSAVRRDTRADRALTLVLFMLYSLPSFFVATLLLFFFSEGSNWTALRVFPTGGFQSPGSDDLTTFAQVGDVVWHLVLPVGCLTYGSLAALSRYMRTGLLEVIQSDYIRTARAKGLPERVVIGKHALRNGLLPIITLLANLLPAVLGGSVVIEYIFGIPGIGDWTISSIYQRDYNVIMGVQLITTVLVLFGMLLSDIGYALVDPRIRYH